MANTLGDIRTAFYLRTGIASDDPKFTADKVNALINTGLRRIAGEFDPWWLKQQTTLTTTANQYSYNLDDPAVLTASFVKVNRAFDDLGNEIVGVNLREWAQYHEHSTQRPRVYYMTGLNTGQAYLFFGPTPDAAYDIDLHYFIKETELTGDGQEPYLPEEYQDYLVCQAALMAAQRARDLQFLPIWNAEIKMWRERLASDVRQTRALPRIVPRDFSGTL